MAERTVTVRLRAVIDAYQKAMRQVAADTAAAAKSAQGSFADLNRKVGELGSDLSRKVTLPLVGVGVGALKVAGDFERSFSQMVGLAGVTADEVDGLRDSVQQLGRDTATSPQQLAEALYFVRSSGVDAAQAMEIVEQAAKASAAGMGEASTIARVATAAMNAYGADNISAARATDILTAAVRNGSFEAAELGMEIGNLIPTASSMGIGFEQVAGVLSAMSLTGTNAAEAATSLNAIFSTLLGTSEEGTRLLEEKNLSLDQLRRTAAGPGGLVNVMRQLDAAFGGNDEQLRTIVPNVRAFRGFMNLLAQDSGKVDNVLQQVAQSAGATDEAFDAFRQTDQFEIQQGLVDVQNALIDLGKTVAPFVGEISQGLGRVLGLFDAVPAEVQDVIVILGLLAVAAGPVIRGFSAIASVVGPAIQFVIRQVQQLQLQLALARMEGIALGPALAISLAPAAAAFAALTVVTLGAAKILGDYARNKQQAAERTRDFVAALRAERDEINRDPAKPAPVLQATLKNIFGDNAAGGREFATMLRETGVDMTRFAQMIEDGSFKFREWGRTAHENAGNTDTFQRELERAADAGDVTARALLDLQKATGFAGGDFVTLVRRLGDVDGSLRKSNAEVNNETHAMRQAAGATGDLRAQQANLDIAVQDAASSMAGGAGSASALGAAMVPVADTIAAAAAEVERMQTAVNVLFGSTFDVARAQQDFFDAVSDVGDAARVTGGSTRNLERDQRSLERATRDVEEAQRELAEVEAALAAARRGPSEREKQDAALDVKDAVLAEKEARQAVREAQSRLREEIAKGKDGDVAGARLDLERAQNNLTRSTLRTKDAQAAQNKVLTSGAETSDKVKQALDDVEDAQDRVRDATERQLDAERTLRGEGATGGPVADRARRIRDSYDEVIRRGEAWILQMQQWGVPNGELITELDRQKTAAQELIDTFGDPDGKLAKFIENIDRLTALFGNPSFQENARRIAQTVGVIVSPDGQIIDQGGGGDTGGGFAARASGGPVRGRQPVIVGEKGWELVTFGTDAFVHDHESSKRMLANGGMLTAPSAMAAPAPWSGQLVPASSSMTITGGDLVVNIQGSVYGPDAENFVYNALQRWQRHNGALRLRVASPG